ncbi:MAG TPA: hypothetical protein VFQ53_06510 [Kofleriaceae bacterium]|nr:hypothetical protein [Kofleriaceae bacterium]
MTTKPPAKGGPKPFLGDDDLLSELDRWDAQFDELHASVDATLSGGESAPQQAAATDWMTDVGPADALEAAEATVEAVDPTELSSPAPADPNQDDDEFDPGADLDAQMTANISLEDYQATIDNAFSSPAPTIVDTLDADPRETDFSDVGASTPPSALGRMLGRATTTPPRAFDDDRPTSEVDIDATKVRDSSKFRRPPTDDDVYTSASRPNRAPTPIPGYEDDPIAPPPAPETTGRRTPAIVRRDRTATPAPRAGSPRTGSDRITPPGGVDVSRFAEQTKVLDDELVEAAAAASRRSQTSVTQPPPIEDDYADIEIGAAESKVSIPAAPLESAPVQRRTAHVLRREAPTRPPPGRPTPVPRQVIELDVDEPDVLSSEPARPLAEDDFSDVAAAVGAADDDLALPIHQRVTAGRPTTPAPSESIEIDLDDSYDPRIERPVPQDLEEAFAGLADGLDEDDGNPLRTMAATPHAKAHDIGTQDTLLEGAARPPLTELYPRVKTPTSVPPLGNKTLTSLVPPAPGARTLVEVAAQPAPRQTRLQTPMPVVGDGDQEVEPVLDLDITGRNWPEQVPPLTSAALDESCAAALLVYEREVATLDDSATSAALRIEAGRLCERLQDTERAHLHYETALLADPRATPALRGLRRIARAAGDLAEATRHLDTEIAVAGALERRPLGHYRVDLLMASGEQDLARVAVGEILDSAPSDVRALIAQLELAFLDGRADEFGLALEQIAHAVSDSELRAAVQATRGVLAAHRGDSAAAASWFSAAAESDPTSLAARLGAVRHAAAHGDGAEAARALVDVARQVESNDRTTAAAAAIRAQHWAPTDETGIDVGAMAASLAIASAPTDPLVARLAVETAVASKDPAAMAGAFGHWARYASAPTDRAYASARTAELDPARGAELWGAVLQLDPGDDYAAAQLRTAHVAEEATQAAIDVDVALAADVERDRARLRAAYGMIAQGELDAAIQVLAKGRAARPGSLAIAEALGEALAAAGKWTERAQLFAELAKEPGDQLDQEVAQLRSAIAWEEAAGALAATDGEPSAQTPGDAQRVTVAALDAWQTVLEPNPNNPAAHAASIVLATRLGDRDVIGEALARAQAATADPLAAASLAYRRARLVIDDPARAEALLRDVQPIDDPRRAVALLLTAARSGELADAAATLEERANQLPEDATEGAALRLRAAQIALDSGDAQRATRLLQQVEHVLPMLGVVPDLLAAARRRAGERPTTGPIRRVDLSTASSADAFARVVRDADLALAQGDPQTALGLYQNALELRPHDPLALVPLIRVATELREPAPLSALALAQLRTAEEAGDGVAKAIAYELLAHIDGDLRGDTGSAQIALESAAQADPTRIDLMHRLERAYTVNDEIAELLRLRKTELELIPADSIHDRAALQLDIAALAVRDQRPEVELAELYRAVLAIDPKIRLALLHLESIVRAGGFSEELAQIEEKIAAYFEGDPRAQAAFWTRAGETLAELGQIDAAVQRFGLAEAALPGHVFALEGWRQAALKGELWIDVAESATRQAAGTTDPQHKAALYHLAGVALMDKALVGEQAVVAFRRALEADPSHRDSFLRLRILLEEDANHDELAILLDHRLEVESDQTARVELHRALAELHRNFLSDRETATRHYRAILDYDPNDLRSHAAVADIAWEQGNWQEAADALMARARLESQPEVLKTLCFRLGLIYADRLVDIPMALKAFQRALTYQPDDENTLVRLADLAAQIGEWKLALGACERLVKNESDADRRVAHLHRVAKIFKNGFGDVKRAERALNLALDSSPTNDDALQELVGFYREARDITSVRVHLNRVTGNMRARVQQNAQDGVAYRVISRAMTARAQTGMVGSMPVARAAAELAELLGSAGDPERQLIQQPPRPDLTQLVRPDADDVLYPRNVQIELRQVFQLLGDRIAKHVGVNVQAYGVSRGDRVRAKDNPVAAVAQTVATALGFGDIDVYLSNRQPWVMVAEPTSPVSLILGAQIPSIGGDAIRFATGGALKLAQGSLAIPARLPPEDLGVLVVALLRLFQPEFPLRDLDPDLVAGQYAKLRRLIPNNLMNELRPFALAIDPGRFGHRELSRDLKLAALRAGLVASGSILAGLRILVAQAQGELPSFLADPLAQGLVSFALGEDHAAIAR